MEGTESPEDCEICVKTYSWTRRAKRLACGHTCCSQCLSRMLTASHRGHDGEERPSQEHQERGQDGEEKPSQEHQERGQDGEERPSQEHQERGQDGEERPSQKHQERGQDGEERPSQEHQERGLIEMQYVTTNWHEIWAGPNREMTNQRIILCPWCRCVTVFPAGLSVNHLPDDSFKMAAVYIVKPQPTTQFSPVFLRMLPSSLCFPVLGEGDSELGKVEDGDGERENDMSSSCHPLTLPGNREGDVIARGHYETLPVTVDTDSWPSLTVPGTSCYLLDPLVLGTRPTESSGGPKGRTEHALPQNGDSEMGQLEREKRVGELMVVMKTDRCIERGSEEEWEEEEKKGQRSRWTRVCVVVVVVIGLLLLCWICLHNITCTAQPFTVISCG